MGQCKITQFANCFALKTRCNFMFNEIRISLLYANIKLFKVHSNSRKYRILSRGISAWNNIP